jgi:stress response protein SCP2
MTNILKGQRIALATVFENNTSTDSFQVDLQISGIKQIVDFSCFGLDKEQKLTNDAYMTFFNQPKTPCGAIELLTPSNNSAGFLCNLHKLPITIDRLVFTAAIDGSETMRQIQTGYFNFIVAGKEIARFSFFGADFQNEKALMLGELYRKDGAWRFCAIGQGFDGGLNALVKHFGGDVAEEIQAAIKISLEKKISVQAPKLIDLAKKATISLEKYKLSSTTARVGLVLDASGSMSGQYSKGKVQNIIERLLPLAVHFDDDEELDTWAFSTATLSLPAATLENYNDYINTVKGGWRKWGMMSTNNEPLVIEQVIKHYKKTCLPVLIIFISDGGVSKNKEIQQLLTSAANLPIFWQFVGIGGRNYGIFEKLDTLPGRIVDNCGFFALDDLDSISEQALYDRLLSEFPLWHKTAKLKNIIPN